MQRFLLTSRIGGRGLWRASGLLLGIWGASYFLSTPSRTVHLDSKTNNKRRQLPDTSRDGHTTTTILDALTQQKSLQHFAKTEYAEDHSRLHEFEKSVKPCADTGIVRYDIVQIASNNPTEDDHAELYVPVPNGQWSFFAVFDGHNGWETSAWLRENLINAVLGSLSDLYSAVKKSAKSQSSAPSTAGPTAEEIESTLKTTFQRLDDDIVHTALEKALATTSRHAAINILAPAHAGSCALLAFYDSHSRLLHVAVTGDSRAVLGRRVEHPDGKGHTYEVRELSADQNGWHPAEESRLLAAHPGELVIKDGRVMGWGMSRAFGDARMKWTAEVQKQLHRNYLGRSTPSGFKTPPYIIAEPEVTCTSIQPGDFLIMATDGLWESLSSEEAVGLVGWWSDNRATPGPDVMAAPTLSAEKLPTDADSLANTSRYRQWNAEKVFIDTDANASTHLIRNALGGANKDLTSALLSMRAPRSRTYMDDITVTVVFFGE